MSIYMDKIKIKFSFINKFSTFKNIVILVSQLTVLPSSNKVFITGIIIIPLDGARGPHYSEKENLALEKYQQIIKMRNGQKGIC